MTENYQPIDIIQFEEDVYFSRSVVRLGAAAKPGDLLTETDDGSVVLTDGSDEDALKNLMGIALGAGEKDTEITVLARHARYNPKCLNVEKPHLTAVKRALSHTGLIAAEMENN